MPAETDATSAGRLGAADERLIRVIGRMPLASAGNLAPILGADERRVRARLGSLRHAGWIAAMSVGMTVPRQQRWFLTGLAARTLYAHDDRPGPDDPSPFSFPDDLPADPATAAVRERLPWTATSRGLRTCVRRLASFELMYRIAPRLVRSGWLRVPEADAGGPADLAMTDFRLLRFGGWFHAVAHYSDRYWVSFTYVGLHVTERALRRKRAHRFWGLDAYSADHDAHERAADRVFYGDPMYDAVPSAQVILAADSWAAHLAQLEFARSARPLICTPDGLWGDPVELRPSGDRVGDPVLPMEVGRAEQLRRWRNVNPDVVAITEPLTYTTFMAIAQFPAMQGDQLSRLLSASPRRVNTALATLVEVGLIDRFDGHCYLTERGLRRAANASRLLASALIRRHGAYLIPTFRNRQRRHDDGVNRLVLQFAAEGATVFVGWRGEINVPGVTQIRPDLVVLVSDGPLGGGAYCLEYERSATTPSEVIDKIRPYRKCAAVGRPAPLLMVCETPQAAQRFAEYDSLLPLLVTDGDAVEAGRLTGDATAWRQRDTDTVSLHCRRASSVR
ncbi:hypothetical protein [Candidatus Poriferisodalis sp.]|uniref:hypothetical protein n=1 Tax=Candidatus Poriferisodalis sp. TaxID=3101277 RepID=UPI003B020595